MSDLEYCVNAEEELLYRVRPLKEEPRARRSSRTVSATNAVRACLLS
jgi:hypothetical protein